jgi:DNA-binding LytR/AlgR family response regulator
MSGWIKLSVDSGSLYLRVEDISAVRESSHYTTVTTVDGESHEVTDDIHDVIREINRIENELIGISDER